MTDQRKKQILEFEDRHKELDDESFYRLAEMRGIRPEEFVEAEEQEASKKYEALTDRVGW